MKTREDTEKMMEISFHDVEGFNFEENLYSTVLNIGRFISGFGGSNTGIRTIPYWPIHPRS